MNMPSTHQPRIVAVVGPSGVGKDTVMAAMVAAHPGIHLAQRVITRPTQVSGEPFLSASDDAFDQQVAKGEFTLWWAAHGMRYGISNETMRVPCDVILVNLSRGVLDQARAKFARFAVLSLTADVDTLAQRLTARGREAPPQMAARLARADTARPAGTDVIEIANEGLLNDTVTRALAAIYPVSL